MASQTLCTQINRFETLPKKVDVTATYNCGIVSVVFDSSYTEQMLKQLPNITLNIYVPVEGTSSFYKYRAITIPTSENTPQSFVLTDIPQSFTFYIVPMFDNYAFYNCDDCNCETEERIDTFPVKIVWSDENIMAGGGSGGGTPTPIPVVPPTVTINMGPDDIEYNEGDIVDIPVPITVTKGSQYIQKIEYRFNGTVVHTVTSGVASGGSFTYTIENVSSNSTISVVVYTSAGQTQQSVNITFLTPYYYGVKNTNTISSLDGLLPTSLIGEDRNFTVTSNNQYIFIVFENTYPDLIYIKDENGFNYLNSFIKSTLNIDSTSYTVYVSETTTTSTNFKYFIK